MSYQTKYFRAVTQSQLPDRIVRNMRTATIQGAVVEFTWLDKEDEWMQKKSLVMLKQMNIPHYAINYLKGITQGAVDEKILKKITKIQIVGKHLTYRYMTPEGGQLYGNMTLMGVK